MENAITVDVTVTMHGPYDLVMDKMRRLVVSPNQLAEEQQTQEGKECHTTPADFSQQIQSGKIDLDNLPRRPADLPDLAQQPAPEPEEKPKRTRRKAAAGQTEPVTKDWYDGSTPEPFPVPEPVPTSIKDSDMMDIADLPKGCEVSLPDFSQKTLAEFMPFVREIVGKIGRQAAQPVVTKAGFKSIQDATPDKFNSMFFEWSKLLYAKEGRSDVVLVDPTGDSLV